ncbi:MAG: hypothetical protein ACKVZJ_00790 [Phycisphaerales bacterium]
MTIEGLRSHHQARPFRPFTLYLADGRSFRVEHPEFLAVTGGGRTIIVTFPDSEHIEMIDLLMVTSIAKGDQPGRGKRKAA